MRNHGNLIVSLSNAVKWLAEQVEARGVNVLAGFPAARIVYEDGQVAGVCSGDMGIAASGAKKPNFEPGTEIRQAHPVCGGTARHLLKELTASSTWRTSGRRRRRASATRAAAPTRRSTPPA